jgi:hypothetical protein
MLKIELTNNCIEEINTVNMSSEWVVTQELKPMGCLT